VLGSGGAAGLSGFGSGRSQRFRFQAFAAYDVMALSVTRRPIFVTISSPKNPVK
jgi:hypothetical protein